MGRKKIKLRRIECEKDRSSKYSKRKKGILKKADEVAMLCDVDIALLLFSPTNKPTLFHSPSRPLNKILEKLSKISSRDREERRAYTIKTLKKVYKNSTESPSENHHSSSERDEVFEADNKVNELKKARELLVEKMSILRDWQNPHEIDDLKRLNIMEKYLISSLNQIREIKIQEDEEKQTPLAE